MTGLKSYSCSKCGGILSVDREQDVLDCPFCGTQFDYVEFHSGDLLGQADRFLLSRNFSAAKEKYETVLSKDPGNFFALRGLVLSAGEINSVNSLDDPANLTKCFYNGSLRVLSENSECSSGPAKEYFAKLSEVITIAQEYGKAYRERRSIVQQSSKVGRIYGADKRINEADHNLKVAAEDYARALEELKKLEPDASAAPQKKIEVMSSVTMPKVSKKIACAKCGGSLVLDEAKKLYLCSHCGVAYGYSLFFGNPMQKAVELLKYGEFEEADQRFSHILMFERTSMDALRGRVLCAGRWKTFAEIRLTEKLTEINWQLVLQRADECCKGETDTTKAYFTLIKETMELLKKYSDTVVMTRIEPNNEEYRKQLETISKKYPLLLRRLMYSDRVQHEISHDYSQNVFTPERLAMAADALKRRDFVEAEDCYGLLVLEHPDEPAYFRGWILCAGKWTAFWKMHVRDYRSDRLFVILSQRITEARQLVPEEYHAYFDKLFELVVLIGKYNENELIIKSCKADEDKISKDAQKGVIDVNDAGFTEMWTELSSKTKRYERIRMDIEKEFKDLLNEFTEMDRELFIDKLSS